MNSLCNCEAIRNLINEARRYENEIFVKLHTEETASKREELFKIKKQRQKQHKYIQNIINNLQSLYDVQSIIIDLEKKK